jgi:hypothetical protein
MDDWPFDQPPNCASLTVRQILRDRGPILHVCHDADDHGWQFLGWADAEVADGMEVCLSEILRLDPSIREVADLPPGWHAWRRAIGETWVREPYPDSGQ